MHIQKRLILSSSKSQPSVPIRSSDMTPSQLFEWAVDNIPVASSWLTLKDLLTPACSFFNALSSDTYFAKH